MRSLVDCLSESIMDDDIAVVNNSIAEVCISLILSDKATKKDLDELKDKVAIWKPKDREELRDIINRCVKIDPNCSLNWIDVSGITDMSLMFYRSKFNGDISKWDVSKVESMYCIFYKTSFNGDISKWNVSNVEDMESMFQYSNFNRDISKWNINYDCNVKNMFGYCKIKDKYKPKVLQ